MKTIKGKLFPEGDVTAENSEDQEKLEEIVEDIRSGKLKVTSFKSGEWEDGVPSRWAAMPVAEVSEEMPDPEIIVRTEQDKIHIMFEDTNTETYIMLSANAAKKLSDGISRLISLGDEGWKVFRGNKND